MGVITNLISMNQAKKYRDQQLQVQSFDLASKSDDPQLRQWGIQNLVDLGTKNAPNPEVKKQIPVLGQFAHLLSGLKTLNPSPSAPKAPEGPAPKYDPARAEIDRTKQADIEQKRKQVAEQQQSDITQAREIAVEKAKLDIDDLRDKAKFARDEAEADKLRDGARKRLEGIKNILASDEYRRMLGQIETGIALPRELATNASQTREDALAAYAQKLGKTVDQLTPQEREDAQNEAAGAHAAAIAGAKPKPATETSRLADAYRAAGMSPEEANRKAGDLVVRLNEAKVAAAKTRAAGGGAGPALTRDQLTALAEGEINGLGTPSFGLSSNNPNRLAYQQAKADLLLGKGVGEAAAERAETKAESGSLTDLTKTRGRLASYEAGAKANLDNFINQAKKIVDSGVPWINTPLRQVAQQGLGSTDLAAYRAARLVALNEIAKVTTSLNGVLSQHAQEEASSISPENSTLNQILAVAEVLKTDMQNRMQGLDQEIANKRQNISKTDKPTGEDKEYNGHTYHRDKTGEPWRLVK